MQTGLENFLQKHHKKYRDLRLGVLCNQASNDADLVHISRLLTQKKYKLNVTCFFGPQHGIRGEKQDNMVESADFKDGKTGLPVYSLYSSTRIPTDAMYSQIDAIVVDLQDVGTRIYTFIYTMAYCMQRAKALGKKVIVLDRPNPIDGLTIEGCCLLPEFSSFVGLYPMVVRHGMTIGELAQYFNEAYGIGCDLEVVRLTGWKRSHYADKWARQWVPPSPNVPTLESVVVFPGSVLFEGTNVSEGRGTTKPFEWIGAPYIQADALAEQMRKEKLKGVFFRPIYFQPTYQKWANEVCGGVQIHVTEREKFNAFKTGVRLLHTIARMYPKSFAWKQPPYEYENDRQPIDLIVGSDQLRKIVQSNLELKDFEDRCKSDEKSFAKQRSPFLLYKS